MISKEEAAEIARTRARDLGWGLREPLLITEKRSWSGKLLSYNVVSDPSLRGTKTRFIIDANAAIILDEGYLPR